MNDLVPVLEKQQKTLEKILGALEKPVLGFHDNSGVTYVYCNRSHGCNWYSLDLEKNPVCINKSSLTGYVRELRFEKVERRGKEVWKLLTTIKADRLYILESGHDSHFSKSLIKALSQLTLAQIVGLITLSPRPGDDESVLFCSVWAGTEFVKASYDKDTNFREVAQKAIALVRSGKLPHA